MRRGVLILLSGLLACSPQTILAGSSASSPSQDDSLAGRCKVGLDMFEGRCTPSRDTRTVLQTSAELEQMAMECTDPASTERIRRLAAACTAARGSAEAAARSERRRVRATYLAKVSALLLDPAYGPSVDRLHDLEDEVERARDPVKRAASERELSSSRADLARLAEKYGIDAGHGKDLDLW